MALWAAKKGVTVLGTGDFTHPQWFAEIKEKLIAKEPGLFRLKPELERWCAEQFPPFSEQPTRFLLEVEISTIYKKGDKTRKVHHLHYMPDLASAERFIGRLARIGNLKADGRPILGLDSRDLLEITLEAGDGAYLIPAHIWTPWFAVLGSKSGFDSIEECYGDLTSQIFALETGLSSDPAMNWRLSQLDRYTLVSNSDAHSPGKIGREACMFDCALDYWAMKEALRTGLGYGGTVEFFPEEGKYHLDGHRACGVRLEPEETRKHGGVCPVCGKELTVGVMHRVAELADRADGARPERPMPFRSLVPLPEVLSEIHRVGAASRKVADSYESLISSLGSELFVLERAPLEEVRRAGSELLAEGIARMRAGRVIRQAGYDGEYGVIRVFSDDELARSNGVNLLFEMPSDLPSKTAPTPSATKLGRRRPEETYAGVQDNQGFLAPPAADRGTDSQEPLKALVLGESTSPLPLTLDPLAGLDSDQRAAAEIVQGPLLIIAGPGTGKTRTLTHRIAHLIGQHDVTPTEVLALTFTNRASQEMRERLARLLDGFKSPLVTTFHGFGWKLLREHGAILGLPTGVRIAHEAERRSLLAETLKLTQHKAGQWLKKISTWKRDPVECSEVEFLAYQQALRSRGWLDFDDLIGLSVELLERSDIAARCQEQFRHVSVDEFQDIDARQYRLIQLLVPPNGHLCAIGDPDQSIYGFRGATPSLFKQIVLDFPNTRTIQLKRNYRSGRTIVQGALQAIAPGSLVDGRSLEALNADASKITIHESPTDKAEAEFVVHAIEKFLGGHGFFSLDSGRIAGSESRGRHSFSDFAVLYRTDAQADLLSEALSRAGFPFQRHTHEPLNEREKVGELLALAREMTSAETVLARLQAALQNLKAESCKPTESRSPEL